MKATLSIPSKAGSHMDADIVQTALDLIRLDLELAIGL